jgi:putative Ca2+/H+ antiporter (TMEM165/GDT1 family)
VTTPYPPPAAQPANDRTTLWGVLGIVLGLLCCPILGVVFGVLALQEAKKVGKPPTLAYIAFAASAVSLIWNIIYATTQL